jgi:hypothetical protein
MMQYPCPGKSDFWSLRFGRDSFVLNKSLFGSEALLSLIISHGRFFEGLVGLWQVKSLHLLHSDLTFRLEPQTCILFFNVLAELNSPSSHVQTVIPRKRSLSILHTYARAAFTQLRFLSWYRVAFIAL